VPQPKLARRLLWNGATLEECMKKLSRCASCGAFALSTCPHCGAASSALATAGRAIIGLVGGSGIAVTLMACYGGPPVDCQAIPTCENGEEQVDACEEGDDTCREVTVCGSTIFCKEAAGEGEGEGE
jgi:hypothetical protein